MAEIIQIDADRPDAKIIRRACALLEAGELVGVPTETVYGIACDPEHLGKLYAAKERDRDKPIARLAASLKQVEALGADFGRDGKALAQKYWPGPLTLVLNTPDGPTGFRVPAHEVPLALARAFGRPIALTSANKSGGTDALNAQEAFQCLELARPSFRASPGSEETFFQTLENPVSLYLDSGECIGKTPSTVIQILPVLSEVEEGHETKILREGAVSAEELKKVIL